MNNYEIAACRGFAIMGASVSQIIKIFPYWKYTEIETIITNIKK